MREVVHQEGHLFVRHVLGAHPTQVAAPAHLAYQVRAALEWENSARNKGGQQVRTSQTLRLCQHSASLMAPAPTGVSDLARYDQWGSLPAGGPASKAGRLTQSPLAEMLLT